MVRAFLAGLAAASSKESCSHASRLEAFTFFNLGHSSNAAYPTEATAPLVIKVFKFLQLKNAFEPISVTLLGIAISVKALQLENAPFPMEVTLSGSTISVKALQPENAYSPIDVTP